MDLDDFAVSFPELYLMIDEDVRLHLTSQQITGEETLRVWDGFVDNLVAKYEQQGYYGYDMGALAAQQINDNFRDWEWDDRNRRRRRSRNLSLRDIIRILFLRRLFDRDR